MRDLQWNDGAPERFEAGMLVCWRSGGICLLGHDIPNEADELHPEIAAWAWLIQPYEIDWLESMAAAHGVGR